MRGNGARPSTTSSSAVSSPKRYSSGPVATVTSTSSRMPASRISAMAASTRARSTVPEALSATTTSPPVTAWAAMSAPSITA